jgi:hypothetical protein
VEEEEPWKKKSKEEEYDEGERSRKKHNTWKEKRITNTKSREEKYEKGRRKRSKKNNML